ncbi:hypothetical protein GWK08_01285 [Leptobacterium flavescens]|uniref:Uncharacterized protein n=1 Tax=Leptobacterium flavescens TaxID=472055 RepID=A0A6P0UFK1_9FLAO|nr:hypothetical protein [Leptobacterium flavescens]NER12061.1 hypothetical protein [Leptobacterium flavescens]
MEELTGNNTTVITRIDPDIPEYLDFKKLRREGLEHIGKLAGKIWTDHNVHDPGITILEVLIYALMDLGYKTNLPFEDLIAQEKDPGADDNFLTPLDILTINPVTIMDYRKLLLEIPEVKNAWLEIAEQEIDMYVDPTDNTLTCVRNPNSVIRKCGGLVENEYGELHLNGLFKVCIEKDIDLVKNEKQEEELIEKARQLLNKHRNLCEDFVEIKILKPLDFGICLEVELLPGFEGEGIYGEIIKRVKNFIQPEIKYYTLNELLDKGKNIDEIFAGRSYRLESFGFVDTVELEKLERRKEIYLSDLYHVILSIEGVRKIKKINLNGGQIINEPALDWVEANRIPEDCVPVFSLENTCVDLYSREGLLKVDKAKVHRSLSFPGKFELPMANLNTEVPKGLYREDLDEYYSIQNDFPVVYGIGEDGLPEEATLKRKTQALQLKGYLMFYDQILANYTAQLTHIRSLFSLKPEAEKQENEKRTYFTQLPDTIPGLEELLKFYKGDTIEGSVLALPVLNNDEWRAALNRLQANPRAELIIDNFCGDKKKSIDPFIFPSAGIRSIYINQLIDSFFNENYSIEILSDRYGYFFTLCPQLPDDIVVVGTKRYASVNEARNEAKNTAFLASLQKNYMLISDKSETSAADKHYFNISFHPISYIDLIRELTEKKEEYLDRRKKFLDHLLARFGEDFTDYTLLQYQSRINHTHFDEERINDQSAYINEFATISRNRGKAFNYLQTSWNSDNVSGFEKRVSLLSGLDNYERRNLCNFEVIQCFRLLLKDRAGNVFFRSNRSYESREELQEMAKRVLTQLRSPRFYRRLEKSMNGFDARVMKRLFSNQASEENIIVSKYHYQQQLVHPSGEVSIISRNRKISSAKLANDKKEEFISSINRSSEGKQKDYRLLPLKRKDHFLNANAFDCRIKTLISWKWHIREAATGKVFSSESTFKDKDYTWENMIDQATLKDYLTEHDTAVRWKLNVYDNVSFKGTGLYPDAYKAVTAWRQAKTLGASARNYEFKRDGNSVLIILKNEKGNPIATTERLRLEEQETAAVIENCSRVFGNRNTKPEYEKEAEKFGFKIPSRSEDQMLVSYCVYNSKTEALQQIKDVFVQSISKKNYLQSGDPGNPEYNFILKDKYNSFLALPSGHFETASDRDRALNAAIRFFKKAELPVQVKEEPRRYVWSLHEDESILLDASSEFSSKARAQSDFDKTICRMAEEKDPSLCNPHIYQFKIHSTPARYHFVYGDSNAQNELEPLFISLDSFEKYEMAEKAYTSFVKKLPGLTFKKISEKKKTYEFALFEPKSELPLVVQYRKGRKKASAESARAVTSYIQRIYTADLKPREDFIAEEMAENQDGLYEWRFYKKNAPLAKSPYLCPNRAYTTRVRSAICDIIPPVNLKECPPKDRVVCPEKNPKKYHYQVCFKDDQDNEFILISYIGFDSYEEAEKAWEKDWLKIIELARDPEQYGVDGKINLRESYKAPDDKSCDDSSFIAVIPEEMQRKLRSEGKDVIQYYVLLANMFPIFKVDDEEDKECHQKYKFRVVIPQDSFSFKSCLYAYPGLNSGSVIWESTDCYENALQAIEAYLHFYNLAGTSNNCRILCDKGRFYVGLMEVLAESSCDFQSEEEAWDDLFPEKRNTCNDCPPGGVREFVYAAEDCKNYIPYCDQKYWKFKVVSPSYYIVDHNCYYNSECERDEQIKNWIALLEKTQWSRYITGFGRAAISGVSSSQLLSYISSVNIQQDNLSEFCELVHIIRECLKICTGDEKDLEEVKDCLKDKLRAKSRLLSFIDHPAFTLENLINIANYFPIYKTEKGYCFRLYWPENDKIISEDGLQPCGCEEEKPGNQEQACNEKYPFISSNCYSCCSEALKAFIEFCRLATNKSLGIECIARTEYGPYSFQIIDKSKELAYHPQQYSCFQDVMDAIEITKACVCDTGMHLLEHILLRPKTAEACREIIHVDEEGNQKAINCLLPICPDYCCPIEWQPDMDKDDPCSESDIFNIHYLPGSDPYSFWATLVLPSWSKRFRTQEARQAFEKLLYREVPALVGLNILWLSPRDLCKFEDAYKIWLEWLENPEIPGCDPDGPPPYCIIADCIKELESEPPCPSIPGEGGECDCGSHDRPAPDPCCLPPDTEGTLFWGHCPPEPDSDIPFDEGQLFITSASDTQTAQLEQLSKKSRVSKKVTRSKAPVRKKKTREKPVEKRSDKELLASIRKRKAAYLKKLKAVEDEKVLKSKSYERALFFVQNAPAIPAYAQLINYFKRYSLNKATNPEQLLELLKNASYHLFDKLALDRKEKLKKEELESLKTSIEILKEKGVSMTGLKKEWKSEELRSLANTGILNQLKRIVK